MRRSSDEPHPWRHRPAGSCRYGGLVVDGRDDWVTKGDELRVRYDPEGVAGPTEDKNSSSYGGLLASLFVAAVVMGTWGGVRQNIGRLVL